MKLFIQIDECETKQMMEGSYGMEITASSSSPANSEKEVPFSHYRIPSVQQGHWRAATEDANQWIQVLHFTIYTFNLLKKQHDIQYR